MKRNYLIILIVGLSIIFLITLLAIFLVIYDLYFNPLEKRNVIDYRNAQTLWIGMNVEEMLEIMGPPHEVYLENEIENRTNYIYGTPFVAHSLNIIEVNSSGQVVKVYAQGG